MIIQRPNRKRMEADMEWQRRMAGVEEGVEPASSTSSLKHLPINRPKSQPMKASGGQSDTQTEGGRGEGNGGGKGRSRRHLVLIR